MAEVYIAHIGTGTLIHVDEAVLVDLGDEQEEVTSDELRSCVVVGTPLNAVIRKAYPGLWASS